MKIVYLLSLLTGGSGIAGAEMLSIIAPKAPPAQAVGFQMGEARQPNGGTLSLDNCSLRLNGEPWTPVMGEFHYSRYPANEWREELLKMKAGGVDIVATTCSGFITRRSKGNLTGLSAAT